MGRPKRYRRIVTGGGVSLTGASVSTSLVPTDAQHCQVLVGFIDDKDVFTAPFHREVPVFALDSVEQVRKIATGTRSLVDSVEVEEEVKHIAAACRTFMREYRAGEPDEVFETCLAAMRAEVGESVAVLVKLLALRPPTNFDVGPYEHRATEILDGWMSRG